MDIAQLERVSASEWRLPARGAMRVPAVLYGGEPLLREMDDKVLEQLANVATLPGIVGAAYAMPDAHWGYGFPIGGVAAFDAEEGGVISGGGVGFDISCGVRTLLTGLGRDKVLAVQADLAEALFRAVPAGVGSTGHIHLDEGELDRMLAGGARWAVERGYGDERDLERTEERGRMAGADPSVVSAAAKRRQRNEVGTLGSGNHYLELQAIEEVFDPRAAEAFGLVEGETVVSIHCGSRGLGHQIGTEFLREMALAAPAHGIALPDRELACAPLRSALGERYLGAMRAAINCALANRQVLTYLTRQVFASFFPDARLPLLFDVSHNTCKEESHQTQVGAKRLFVHRKGATRAFGPGDPTLPRELKDSGQPILIGGSMGTCSAIMRGIGGEPERAFASTCHGAGRRMSRHQAAKRWRGRALIDDLARHGILIRSRSSRGVAEEAPGAYKDLEAVVDAAAEAGLGAKVASLRPLVCVKG